MQRYDRRMLKLAPSALLVACAADSTPSETARHFYDRSAFPVLEISCATNTSGCHSRTSGPTAYFIDSNDAGYQTSVVFAGNFDANAPLLVAHPTFATLSPAGED